MWKRIVGTILELVKLVIQKWSAADGKSSCQHYCGTYNSVRRGDRLVHLKLSFVLEGRFFLSSINTPHIQPLPSRLQAGGRECVPRVHAARTALYITSLPPLQTTLTKQRGESAFHCFCWRVAFWRKLSSPGNRCL